MTFFYFVYETTNLVNGKKYRGIHKTTNLNDGYLGSGIAFELAVKKYGKSNFVKEILEYCSSYDELIEREKFWVDENWIKDDNNYNLKTGGQSAGILSDASKNKISETLKRRYASGEIIPMPRTGFVPWNKGKNLSCEQKEKISVSSIKRYMNDESHPLKIFGNKIPWNKGKKMGPMSEEGKERRSKTLKERYKNENHPTKGRDPWNKGKKGAQVAWNKGVQSKKTECPFCNQLVDVGNAKRWHFSNCKIKEISKYPDQFILFFDSNIEKFTINNNVVSVDRDIFIDLFKYFENKDIHIISYVKRMFELKFNLDIQLMLK